MKAKSNSTSEVLKTVKDIPTTFDVIRMNTATYRDLNTGETTYQRAQAAAANTRGILKAMELHHNFGGDISEFLRPGETKK